MAYLDYLLKRLRQTFKKIINGTIPYQSLTIGELSYYIIETRIQTCTDYKL